MHYIFTDHPKAPYKIGILIKELAFNKAMLEKYYIDPLVQRGLPREEFIALPLKYNEHNKCTIAFAKGWLGNILKWLTSFDTEYLLVTDPTYLRALTGVSKVEPYHGYVLNCKLKGFEHFKIIYSINFSALFYNPKLQSKLDLSLNTLQQDYNSLFLPLGHDIIHSEYYPESPSEVRTALQTLYQYPRLTCDIETFSLAFYSAGIGTIGFAWDQHNGLAIPVEAYNRPNSKEIIDCLRVFFSSYKGELIFHGGTFDLKVLVYMVYMEHLLDLEGMLNGIAILTESCHDTKLIAYLASNSCAGNTLDLKSLAHEFAGNYAQDDIKDITKIPKEDLLRYNLIDCLATWHVFDKYYPIMIANQQGEIYQEIFLPSMPVIIQMELTGMPLDLDQVANAKSEMQEIMEEQEAVLRRSPLIFEFDDIMREQVRDAANAKLKVKVKPLQDFVDVEFNPNSGPQIQRLLHDVWGLPVIDKTVTGQPATGAETLEKVKNALIQKYNITPEEIENVTYAS